MKNKSSYCPVCRHIVCQACGDISVMPNIEQSLLSYVSTIQCSNCGCFSDIDTGIRDHSAMNQDIYSPMHQHKIRKGSLSVPELNTKTEYIKGLSNSEGLGGIQHFIKDMELNLMKMFVCKPIKPAEVLFTSDDISKIGKEKQKLDNKWIKSRDGK